MEVKKFFNTTKRGDCYKKAQWHYLFYFFNVCFLLQLLTIHLATTSIRSQTLKHISDICICAYEMSNYLVFFHSTCNYKILWELYTPGIRKCNFNYTLLVDAMIDVPWDFKVCWYYNQRESNNPTIRIKLLTQQLE